MDIPNHAELLDRIETFCRRHNMAETRFGREAVSNPNFISGLRKDPPVSPTLKTLTEVQDFMARTDAEAETRAKLTAPLDALPPTPEEETELPFRQAPVNPTGASLPISSPTNARLSLPAANGCSRSTGEAHDAEAQIPSCSADEDETAGPLPLVTGQTWAEGRTPGAPPVLSQSSLAGPSTPTVASGGA